MDEVAVEHILHIGIALSGYDGLDIHQHGAGAAGVQRKVDKEVFGALFLGVIQRPLKGGNGLILELVKQEDRRIIRHEKLSVRVFIAVVMIRPLLDELIFAQRLCSDFAELFGGFFVFHRILDVLCDRGSIGTIAAFQHRVDRLGKRRGLIRQQLLCVFVAQTAVTAVIQHTVDQYQTGIVIDDALGHQQRLDSIAELGVAHKAVKAVVLDDLLTQLRLRRITEKVV